MTPNNNFSVLPWYTSIDQQNARKWWIYNRIYPLFTPATFLLPFQVLRAAKWYTPGTPLVAVSTRNAQFMYSQGIGQQINFDSTEATSTLACYDVEGLDHVFLTTVPICVETPPAGFITCNVIFVDSNNMVLGAGMYDKGTNEFTGALGVPENAKYVWIQEFYETYSSYTGTAAEAVEHTTMAPITSFGIYRANGSYVGDFSASVIPDIIIKPLGDLDCIIYPGTAAFTASFQNGQYYAVMTDRTNTWYSEIFTVVNDIAPCLKIEWWDLEDFVMDAGTIVYQLPGGELFKNALYIQSEIAKPEYLFEEEGESRDGYFFPIKQISEKHYRFAFLASEYLLDVMRFIRMADFAQITKDGHVYKLDTFLITPEWEDNGDVAAVTAEFDTDTVAKKIGLGYIKAENKQ